MRTSIKSQRAHSSRSNCGLQETRHLMLSKGFDPASAGYHLKYGNAAQFTREYKRLFGAPPMRNIKQLRETPTEGTAEF